MIYFVAEIQRDEQRGGAFEITRVVERADVDGADAGNFFDERADGGFGFQAIATDQRIAVDGVIEICQRFGAQAMERGNHSDAGRHETRGLLCRRAVPHTNGARQSAAHRDCFCGRLRHIVIARTNQDTHARFSKAKSEAVSFSPGASDHCHHFVHLYAPVLPPQRAHRRRVLGTPGASRTGSENQLQIPRS